MIDFVEDFTFLGVSFCRGFEFVVQAQNLYDDSDFCSQEDDSDCCQEFSHYKSKEGRGKRRSSINPSTLDDIKAFQINPIRNSSL